MFVFLYIKSILLSAVSSEEIVINGNMSAHTILIQICLAEFQMDPFQWQYYEGTNKN